MNPSCKEIRKHILHISKDSGHGHVPTCFSIVEMLYATYEVMQHDPHNPSWENRDIFILSKGHGALAHYCILADFGYFDIEDVSAFGAFESNFGCHADRHKIRGIEVSTGSLGHGIGVAVGAALAFKIDKNKRRVFALVGDGESNEGSVWEAIMVAENLKLDNLTIIYDHNLSQLRGLQLHKPVDRFKGFGCDVIEVDGHNVDELKKGLKQKTDTVKVVVANAIKGFGCETLVENKYAWHRKSPSEADMRVLIKELDEKTI